jgi:hypothetical protein
VDARFINKNKLFWIHIGHTLFELFTFLLHFWVVITLTGMKGFLFARNVDLPVA